MKTNLKFLQILLIVILFFCGSAIAQTNVIGNPIKIGNIEVAQYDFRKIPWNDANNSCKNLGDGWRLPTKEELNILYQNKEKIGNFKWDSYWSSTKGNVVVAWRLNFGDGMIYDRDNTDNTACVRAVRNSKNNIESTANLDQKIEISSNKFNSNSIASQAINKCKIDGNNITPIGYKYFEGECDNSQATGVGRIYYYSSEGFIKGVFKNNKLDETNSVEEHAANGIFIGAMQNQKLNGPFQAIWKEGFDVSETNYDNGRPIGNAGDQFVLPRPIFETIEKNKGFIRGSEDATFVFPNTTQILTFEYGFLTIYDFSINKLVTKYAPGLGLPGLSYNVKILGVLNKNIYVEVTYNKETNAGPVLVSKKKYILNIVEKTKGLVTDLPLEILESSEYIFNKKYKLQEEKRGEVFFKNKAIITSDKKFVFFCSIRRNLELSSDTIFKRNLKDEEISKIVLPNSQIHDFSIDEKRNRILVSYQFGDSIKLSYYSLDEFKFIKDILAAKKKNGFNSSFYFTNIQFYGDYSIIQRNGNVLSTLIFHNDELYFGFEGILYGINNINNLVIGGYNTLTTYDLNKRSIISRDPVSPRNFRFYKQINNDLVFISSDDTYYKLTFPKVSNPINQFVVNQSSRSKYPAGLIWVEGKYEKLQDKYSYKDGYWASPTELFNPSSIKIGSLEVAKNDLGILSPMDAKMALESIGDGWRLPTKEELIKLYQNSNIIGGFNKNPGEGYYISSSEKDANFWAKSFYDGNMYLVSSENRVRPVRTFGTVNLSATKASETKIKTRTQEQPVNAQKKVRVATCRYCSKKFIWSNISNNGFTFQGYVIPESGSCAEPIDDYASTAQFALKNNIPGGQELINYLVNGEKYCSKKCVREDHYCLNKGQFE